MVGCHSFLSGHNSLREAHFHWDLGGCMVGLPTAKGVHVQESKKIKSCNFFPVNKISRDVKGLFLGHRFVWSRVIFKVTMMQLEDELLGKGRG
jgi:hypothetical protein